MHCNGHCYLSKQLKKAEEKERKQLPSLKEKEEQVLSIHEVECWPYFPSFVETGSYIPFRTKEFTASFKQVLPPPEAFC